MLIFWFGWVFLFVLYLFFNCSSTCQEIEYLLNWPNSACMYLPLIILLKPGLEEGSLYNILEQSSVMQMFFFQGFNNIVPKSDFSRKILCAVIFIHFNKSFQFH